MAAMLISAPAAPAQDEMTVSIQDFFFDPDQLTVAPGTTVTWVNEGQAPHTVTSTDGKELDSATLQPGDTYSFTFKDDDAGETYAYQCTIHPQMTASVNVFGERFHEYIGKRISKPIGECFRERVTEDVRNRWCSPAPSGGCSASGLRYPGHDRHAARLVASRFTWLRGSLRPSAKDELSKFFVLHKNRRRRALCGRGDS